MLTRLQKAIDVPPVGDVNTKRLVETNLVSQLVSGFSQYTQNDGALERARDESLAIHPGQDVEHVVVDDLPS